jgi:hypothetical protein
MHAKTPFFARARINRFAFTSMETVTTTRGRVTSVPLTTPIYTILDLMNNCLSELAKFLLFLDLALVVRNYNSRARKMM